MLADPAFDDALDDFGAVSAGIVIVRGGGLRSDFCVLARFEPGRAARLEYPEDEDELEELGPDYIAWAPYTVCRSLLRAAFAGEHVDPVRVILDRNVKVRGDLERLVRHASRHRAAGLDALRAVPTEFV
jgi:hypothetical protein